MRGKKRQRLVMVFLPVAVAVGLVACDDDPSGLAPVMEDPAILAAMEAAIQDEFRATFSSLQDACGAGVVAEIENAAIYSRYLELPLPSDVRTVFESNRAASLDKHLPAFERCS